MADDKPEVSARILELEQAAKALAAALNEAVVGLDWQRDEVGPEGGFSWESFIAYLAMFADDVSAALDRWNAVKK